MLYIQCHCANVYISLQFDVIIRTFLMPNLLMNIISHQIFGEVLNLPHSNFTIIGTHATYLATCRGKCQTVETIKETAVSK